MIKGLINIMVLSQEETPFCAKLHSILAHQKDMMLSFFTYDLFDAINYVSREKPDIIIYYSTIPVNGTLADIRQLKKMFRQTRVILIVSHPNVHFAVRAYKSGISGYLPDNVPEEEVMESVRKTMAGGKYVAPWLAGKLVDELHQPTQPEPHEKLTDREYLIMCLLAAEKPVHEIAEELNIQEKTVAGYRASIMQKMHFSQSAEIRDYMKENRLSGFGNHNIRNHYKQSS